MKPSLSVENVITGGAVLLTSAYIGSYVWQKVTRPEAIAAQNQLKELQKIINAPALDEQALLTCLTQLVRQGSLPDKRELMRNAHVFVSLCGGAKTLQYSMNVINVALDIIRSIGRVGEEGKQALCRVGGFRVLFIALTRAYTECMTGSAQSGAARDVVEKLLGVLDELISFDDKLVALPFDIPPQAEPVAQLADMKALGSIAMLLNPEHGFAHKRSRVLAILAAVTSIKKGALRIMSATQSECVNQLLFYAAKTDSRDYTNATKCIKNLVRFSPEARKRVLSTEPGVEGLANLPRLRDQFIELIDGAAVGYPPRTQFGPPRDPSSIYSGLTALKYLLESSDSKATMNEAMIDSNQRGILALFGIMARSESEALREMAASMFPLLSEEPLAFAEVIHNYTGAGENAEKWGTGFRVRSELEARERKTVMQKREAQQKMRKEMQQRMMMMQGMGGMGMGGNPEDLLSMMGPEMYENMMMGQ